MSMTIEDDIKRWTTKRKAALVMEIIQGKTTVAEASRTFDLTPSEAEEWVDEAKRGMEKLKGWQVKKRPVNFRPRVQALPSVAQRPNDRGATDLCRASASQDGWSHLALVIDCHTRELLGWHLSRSGKSQTAESAQEHALINRFGCLGRVPERFLLRGDNGLVFTSRHYTALVKSYGLQQKFITPYTPEQNGMVERVIRTLKGAMRSSPSLRNANACRRVIAD